MLPRSALIVLLILLATPLAHAQWEYVGPGRFDRAELATDGTVTYLNARISLNADSLTYPLTTEASRGSTLPQASERLIRRARHSPSMGPRGAGWSWLE